MNIAGLPSRTTGQSRTISQALAAFVAQCGVDTMPAAVVARAKLYVLDALVVALAGANSRSSQIVVDLVNELGGHAQSTVIGRSFKTSVALAALANGAITHAVEL